LRNVEGTFSQTAVRRLAVVKQQLTGRLPPKPTSRAILSVVRDLGYVQWDPVSIVAPSHLLTLWNRVGDFRLSDLDRLLWKEKKLFEHWTPMASLVLTEDFPLYSSLMRRYPQSLSHSWANHRARARKFLAEHRELRTKMLAELRDGPLRLSQFKEHLRTKRNAPGWEYGSDVSQMLFHLTMSGEVMVVGHEGNQNLWGLAARFLPGWVDRTEISESEADRLAAQRAIRSLGTASPPEITYHFVRGRYDRLDRTLADLERNSLIHRVTVEGLGARDERYVHHADLALLESLEGRPPEPRISLLPPFDNLLYSPIRTKRLFGFDYVREQFLPKEKRRFGTYVLPVLWGDRLIGRVDPKLDRESGELVIQSVHAEPGAPAEQEVARELSSAISRLAHFLGARAVRYTAKVPAIWKSVTR
jgi:uncharacterized protein YcaQ